MKMRKFSKKGTTLIADVTSILRPEKCISEALARAYNSHVVNLFGLSVHWGGGGGQYQKAGYATAGASCSFMVSNWRFHKSS